jgi:hypothetical protein
MGTVADYADEFVRKARSGENPSVFVPKQHLESFLEMLKREGIEFAKSCLTQISDPEMRKIVETIFFFTVIGATVGAGIGVAVAGPPGAQVGAIIGGAAGFAAGCIAVTVVAKQRGDGLQISVAS